MAEPRVADGEAERGRFLIAVARDPHTLFVYWHVDWPKAFAEDAPAEKRVQLRITGDSEATTIDAEPMAGSSYVAVEKADSSYEVELGYEGASGDWHTVAKSPSVLTPSDQIAE